MKNGEKATFEEAAEPFLSAFRGLEGLDRAELAANGYINLRFSDSYWQQCLPDVKREMPAYGLDATPPGGAPVVVEAPEQVRDLAEARLEANAEILTTLAGLAGWPVSRKTRPAGETRGLSLAQVVARCGAGDARFALIANQPAFTKAFSLNLAIDKSYDNPVFCIPYARQMVRRLTAGGHADEGEGKAPDLSVLDGAVELRMIKLLCKWPLAVERAVEKQDVFYLTSFLQDISLLFFRLMDTMRPISSDYLKQEATCAARLYLLATVDTVLTRALDILGIPAKKEFE